MGMDRRGVEALHVIERDRRIDHETEQPCTERIPECDRDEEVDRPIVVAHPIAGSVEPYILARLKADKEKRYDFELAENGSEGQHHGGRAREVKVVLCSNDAAAEKDGGSEHHRHARSLHAQKLEPRE